MRASTTLWLTLCIAPALASVSRGDFQHPPVSSRPLFRYWVPDASVDGEILQSNVRDAGSIGAGGVEFLPFYNYGGELGKYPPGADWGKYGFGTRPFQDLFRKGLLAHKSGGMRMDFSLGPNQGQGVPAYQGDQGLQWDLVPFHWEAGGNKSFNGTLPGWGTGKLIALVMGSVLSKTSKTPPPAPIIQPSPPENYTVLQIEDGSLVELPLQLVSSNGLISVSPRDVYTNTTGEPCLFAFYENQTLHKNLLFSPPAVRDLFDNGSFVVDHFSAAGAETVIQFWEKYILKDDIRQLLREVGGCAWEDSLEIKSHMSWTPELPVMFEAQHGYKIHKYLPLLMFGNNNLNIQGNSPGRVQAVLSTHDGGQGYINDFRATLNTGYANYLKRLRGWTHDIGVGLSVQPVYNMPMDIMAAIPYVDVPETESLGFVDNIDGYRQVTGVAALTNKTVSNEMGAKFLKAYQLSFLSLLDSINRAFAGGVSRFLLHGQSYTGSYYGTTWPGYTAFQYTVSELFSPRLPSWSNGLADLFGYISRTSYSQQKGLPRIDIAMYHKASATNFDFRTIYPYDDLTRAGYSFGYLSPDNFELAEARVAGGVLGPDGPKFRAMVLTSLSNLTVDAVHYLAQYAEAGLPLVISGNPGFHATGNSSAQEIVETELAKLKKAKGVYICNEGEIAKTLSSAGINPRVAHHTNGTWYSTWREDPNSGVDYLFVMGSNQTTTGRVEVTSAKFPYILDAWTGQRLPLLHFSQDVERKLTSIPLALAAYQTAIFAFSPKPFEGIETPAIYMTNLPSSAVGVEFTARNGLVLKLSPTTQDYNQQVVLSDKSSHRLSNTSCAGLGEVELDNWSLTVEHWEAPNDLSDLTVIANKRNTTHHAQSPLRSWAAINNSTLATASGVGYYSTTFAWPPPGCSCLPDGATIKFPPVPHGIRLWINGKMVPPMDITSPKADIGALLQKGENKILAVVPTSLWNYLKSILSELRTSAGLPFRTPLGEGPEVSLPPPGLTDTGLIGKVVLTPYKTFHIRI